MSPSSRQLTVVATSVLSLLFVGSVFSSNSAPDAVWPLPSASAQTITGVGPDGDAFLAVADTAEPAGGPTETTSRPSPFEEPDPEVLEELSRGRYWHASRLLDGADEVSPLLRARAEAGWGNWSGAWGILSAFDGAAPDGTPLEDAAIAWALRGRAADEIGRADDAVESYRAALESPTDLSEASSTILRIRLARVLATAGLGDSALVLLSDLNATAPWATSWLGLDLARSWVEAGDPQRTARALEMVTDPEARREGWDLGARAYLTAGDTAAALDGYLEHAREGEGSRQRAEAWSRIGEIRLALEERDPAHRALRNALAEGPVRQEVAEVLLDLGVETADEAIRVYRVLRRGGDEDDALEALDRYAELLRAEAEAGAGGRATDEVLSAELRLERAELLAEVDRLAEASRELEGLSGLDEMEVAAPALDLLASVRRRQGLYGEYRTFQELLVRRFPSHPDAVDVVFFRADDLHDRQEWEGALSYYGQAVEMAPDSDRAGLARMRMGQIHLTRGSLTEAARVYEGYLDAFPRGRRWDEARYWAAWSRLGLGQPEEGRAHVTAILDGDPLSYYAILGLRLLEQSFAPDVPDGSPPPSVQEIDDALDRVEVLREAGLDEGVEPVIEDLMERYDASQDTLLRLSLELSERGFSMDGISTGWEVQSRGRAWDRWLVRAVYPFPYRDLVRLEAEEWGLDPFYLAALIRQESAFLAEARSGAGAMGLMQVIPSTGESMARSVGPEGFSEHHLLHPEVNLHLGAAFLARLHDRFGDRSPLVLAAYNAGPTRASRWERDFPEARELERFTERIPYEETRGYVKRVTRNVELYRWLYGSAE